MRGMDVSDDLRVFSLHPSLQGFEGPTKILLDLGPAAALEKAAAGSHTPFTRVVCLRGQWYSSRGVQLLVDGTGC